MQMEVKRKPGSNTCIRQTRLWNKDCNKRQRRALYNYKADNPTGRYNNCKYALNMRAPKYMKQLITNIKELINSNTLTIENYINPTYINGQMI